MTTSALVRFEAVRQALMEAHSIDEVKDVRDKAEALRLYMRQAGESLEMQNAVAEIKLRAERRAGEILAEMERGKPGPAPRDKRQPDAYLPPENPRQADASFQARISEEGISEPTARRWQTIAAVPEERFEAHIAKAKAMKNELTTASMLRLAQSLRQSERQDIPPPVGFYRCLIIDPPWPIKKILREVHPNQIELDYPTMTLEEIAELPIAALADPAGCHIYLWVTHKFLPAGLRLFERWDVRYQCLLTWVKNVGFTPFSWMYSTEHVLFGRVGSLDLLRQGLRLDFAAPGRVVMGD